MTRGRSDHWNNKQYVPFVQGRSPGDVCEQRRSDVGSGGSREGVKEVQRGVYGGMIIPEEIGGIYFVVVGKING